MTTASKFDIERYRGIVIDLDGVVWLGKVPIPGAADTVNALIDRGLSIRFLTNNSGMHRSGLVEKLQRFGIRAQLEHMITAGSAAAAYVARHYGPSAVHIMGTDGLKQELLEAGHREADQDADLVIVGFDQEFTWSKLDRAFANLLRQDCAFIACNYEPWFIDHERLRPGTGANVAALAYCARREPEVVIGKPHRHIMDVVVEGMKLPSDQCLIIGDKLAIDIAGGQVVGFDTMFVLTGEDKQEDIARTGITPTYVLESIRELLP